ncbi:MAG: MFS transporter [Pseudomonadota bacterium]
MSYAADIRAAWRTWPCFVLMGTMWGGFHAYVPQVKSAAGASDAAFGLALLASAVGSLAAMALAPKFETWTGSHSLALCGAVMVCCFPLLAGVGSVFGLTATLIVIGMTLGLTDVVMNAQVARDEAATGRSLMNLNHGLYSLAYAVAALTAAPLRGAGLGPEVFYGCALAFAAVILWPVRSAGTSDAAASQTKAERTPLPAPVIWGGIIVLLSFASENAVESWSALHVERTLDGSPAQGALAPAAMGITMAIGRLSGQWLVPKGRERQAIQRASVVAASGALLAALAWTPAVAWAGFALAGLGLSILAPLALSLIGQIARPEVRTHAVARGTMIGYAGFFFGPPIMGMVAELAGLRAVYLLIAMSATSILLALWAMDRHREPS